MIAINERYCETLDADKVVEEIENCLDTMRKNGKEPPYCFLCNNEVYLILKSHYLFYEEDDGVYFYSKKDGTKVQIGNGIQYEYEGDFGFDFHFSEKMKQIFARELLRRQIGDFGPQYFYYEPPKIAREINFENKFAQKLQEPYREILKNKSKKQDLIPKNKKRKDLR